MRPLRAARVVPAAPEAVFAFLADLENHWELADRFVEVVELHRDRDGAGRGGLVRLRGPLGVRRTVATRVLTTDPPCEIAGVAELGRRTRAVVRWTLAPSATGTRVTLEATLAHGGALDRALLALGGHAWLSRRFAAVLERLSARLGGSPAERTSARSRSPLAPARRPSGAG